MEYSPPRSGSVLDERTLVLNRSWIPVHVTSVRRAFVLMFHQAAVAVRPDTYETFDFGNWAVLPPDENGRNIRTVRTLIRAPEVILLSKYDRLPRRQIPFSRRNLCRRDQLRCQYCGRRPSVDQLTIDHVLPRCQGGTTGWSNCVLACVPCNRKKGSRTPEQAGMRLLSPPGRPDWAFALGFDLPSLGRGIVTRLVERVSGNVSGFGAV